MCLGKPKVCRLFRKWEYIKEKGFSGHLVQGSEISHRPSIHLDKSECADKKSSKESLLKFFFSELIFSF